MIRCAVTSHATVADERKAHEVGCDKYLSKPINVNELIATVKKLFGP